jgi:hypothetical protein
LEAPLLSKCAQSKNRAHRLFRAAIKPGLVPPLRAFLTDKMQSNSSSELNYFGSFLFAEFNRDYPNILAELYDFHSQILTELDNLDSNRFAHLCLLYYHRLQTKNARAA